MTGELLESSDSGKETWSVSCTVFHRGSEHFMAAFKRESRERPFSPGGFYSFIEDWDRTQRAQGHLRRRRAEFIDPYFTGESGDRTLLRKATFTKVEDGLDAKAKKKAVAKAIDAGKFELCTGGPDDEEESGLCEVRNHTVFET